jgi:hypothetical protein
MRKLIVPLAILAMGVLLGSAVVFDCVRLAHDAYDRVEVEDADMVKYENRFVKQLEGSSKSTPEVNAAIGKLQAIHSRVERMGAYDSLVAAFRNTMSGKIDSTNQMDRKFMDEATGAMNRRDVAQKRFDTEQTAFLAYMDSWRGKIARTFSPAVRRDAENSQSGVLPEAMGSGK